MDTTVLLRVFAFVLLGGWLLTALRILRTLRSIRRLPHTGSATGDAAAQDAPSGEASALPSLSVIIPFRDEAESLADTVAPLLETDLPVEVILIDDHSTDGSGAIADRLAACGRVRVLRPGEPPPGWLGKPWACHHGAAEARGEYLLFMDADVALRPSLLPDLLHWLAQERPPHLVIFPHTRTRGLLESSYMTLFVFLFLIRFDPHAARDPRRSGHVGVGAFNLVRRDVYARFGGYASLRLAVADDVMLGKRVKETGGWTCTLHAGEAVCVRWRKGFRDTLRATRRSLFPGTGFSPGWLLLAIAGTLGGIVAPFALTAADDALVRLPAAGASLLVVVLPALLRRGRYRLLSGLLLPVQALVFLGVYCMSAADVLRGRPLRWRGRSYDLRTLRRWQRGAG